MLPKEKEGLKPLTELDLTPRERSLIELAAIESKRSMYGWVMDCIRNDIMLYDSLKSQPPPKEAIGT